MVELASESFDFPLIPENISPQMKHFLRQLEDSFDEYLRHVVTPEPQGTDGTPVKSIVRRFEVTTVNTTNYTAKLFDEAGGSLTNAVTIYPVQKGVNDLTGNVSPDLGVGDDGSCYKDINGLFYTTFPVQDGLAGGGLDNVVEDATPQLGGALDCLNENITNVGTLTGSGATLGDITIAGNIISSAGNIYLKPNGRVSDYFRFSASTTTATIHAQGVATLILYAGATVDFQNSDLTTTGNITTTGLLVGPRVDTLAVNHATSLGFKIGNVEQMALTDGKLAPTIDNDIDLGDSTHEYKDGFFDGTLNTDSLVADTADINGGTVDGATIGQSSAAVVRGSRIEVDNNTTHIDKDGSNNMTFTDAVHGTKTLSEMGSPTMVDVSDTAVAEGYNDITGFNNKVLIKWIEITTSSTDWTFTAYEDDDAPGAHAREIVSNRSSNYKIYWDYSYEDVDASSEFHYRFVDNSGANTHNIRILGYRLL